ncbi:hypothetical protein Trco_001485 [Trichoderma cornu-damae]|uniref:Uncharacterized protein n=1 Tax=Trichoderma cornu-damae TaxID=654480 RepID=A0A9P8QSE9_9HYPO|nr:hypothetical protein Trco_001485 [Trichoderma cornu-damae]
MLNSAESSCDGYSDDTPSGGSSSSTRHVNDVRTSFLFVVNELRVRLNEDLHNGDHWYNRVPPTEPSGFEGEIPSRVMRYRNGQVEEAVGYRWAREAFQESAWPPGYVFKYDPDGIPTYTERGEIIKAAVYKEMAVFSCNPLLPIVVINGDPLSATGPLDRSPLLFFHPPHQQGVSQAVHPESLMDPGPRICKYAAGAAPSWMPSLVPETYRNPYDPVQSAGLAGELPIVLGLMAFSEPVVGEEGESVTQIFLGDHTLHGRWHCRRWKHSAAPRGYALSAAEHPRGFLVAIFKDPDNQEFSTEPYLSDMEWNGIIVHG